MLLQMGVPGGVELLVIFIMMLMMFGVPLLVVTVGGYLWFRQREDSRERIDRLEDEIAQLKAELGDGPAEYDGDLDESGDSRGPADDS